MLTASTQTQSPIALIVDDQEWSSRSLESVLSINGYRTIRAGSIHAALEAVEHEQLDLLLISSDLPNGNSLDLCRAVRKKVKFGLGLPILMMAPDPPSRKRRLAALRAGAWGFVSHPVDPEELLLRLDAYWQARFALNQQRKLHGVS